MSGEQIPRADFTADVFKPGVSRLAAGVFQTVGIRMNIEPGKPADQPRCVLLTLLYPVSNKLLVRIRLCSAKIMVYVSNYKL